MTDPESPLAGAESPRPRRRFHGWRVVLVGSLMLVVAGSYGNDVGWPGVAAAVIGTPSIIDAGRSFGLSYLALTLVLQALLLPFAGTAVDRWGSRRMVMLSMIVLAVGMILYLATVVPGVFFVVAAVLSIGSVMGSKLPMTVAVSHWYVRRRCRALAFMVLPSLVGILATSAFGIGSTYTRTYSFEMSVVIAAAIWLLLAWPVSRLFADRPEDRGQHPDGMDLGGSADATSLLPEYGWQEALRNRAFWLLVVGSCGAVIASSWWSVLPALPENYGFTIREIAWLSFLKWLQVPLTLVGGLLGDRLPIHRVMFGFAAVAAAGVLASAFATSLPALAMCGAVVAIGAGGLTVLPLAASAEYFGRRNLGTVLGTYLCITNLVRTPTSFLVILAVTAANNMPLIYVTVGLLSTLGALAYLFMGNPRPAPSQLEQERNG